MDSYCEYCGKDLDRHYYFDLMNATEGHLIFECKEVPESHRKFINDPTMQGTSLKNQPWYVVEYTLWPTTTTNGTKPQTGGLGRHKEVGTFRANSETSAINGAMYETRGRKTDFEIANVSEVLGPFDTIDEAMEEADTL